MPRQDVVDKPAIGDGLCVSNLFQSNMVVQRDRPLKVWGWAAPGEQVTVNFAGRTARVRAASDRSWTAVLDASPVSREPQAMSIYGEDESLVLDNILVGDVWVLGGQSNMEFPLAKVENGALEIASANYDGIRVLTVPAQHGPEEKQGFPRLNEWSDWSRRHFRKGDWDVCSPKIARDLSAIGYVFARRVHMASRAPIGVIDVSRGGTTVETWTPDAVMRGIETPEVTAKLASWDQRVAAFDPEKDLKSRIKRHRNWLAKIKADRKKAPADRKEPSDLRPGPAADQNRPGNCYASMIAPLRGLSVKGAIFHQGYNNCFGGTPEAVMYSHVFPRMIAAWREAFEDPAMPFGILSLCTEGSQQTLDNYVERMANAGPYIREAQYQTFLDLYNAGDKNIGFVSTYDLRRRWYHPQLKAPAGERIARWALATQYGYERQIRWKPPMIKQTTVEGGRITIAFDEPIANVDDGGAMKGFAVAGVDRRFHPAEAVHPVTGKDGRGRAQRDMKKLVLSSRMVPKPIHYRYAWARNPLGNVQAYNHTDIPLATQRSDSWTMRDVYDALVGKQSETLAALERGERREFAQALRGEDRKRRLANARAVSDGGD